MNPEQINICLPKVLSEQSELSQIFREHETFRKKLRMNFRQAMIHLSKVVKC